MGWVGLCCVGFGGLAAHPTNYHKDAVINEEVDEHDSTTAKLLFDILIMAHANGKERNKKEWENLFFEASFSHYKISSSFGIKSLVEVYP